MRLFRFFKKGSPLKIPLFLIFSLTVFTSFYFFQKTSTPKSDECLFLENIMIRYGGLYVLLGSKPMIDFPIDSGFPETEEECARQYESYVSALKQGNLAAMNYSEYVDDCKNSFHRHHRRLWNAWRTKMSEYLGPCYLFLSESFRGREFGYFINIPSLLLTLKRYYPEFVEANGGPFDSEQMVAQIGNPDSPFWTKLFQSSYHSGLLLGYGKRNAFLFGCEQQGKKFMLPRFSDLEKKLDAHVKKELEVKDLPLPEFCTFSLADEVMEKISK